LLGLLLGAVLWLPGRRRAADAATTEDDGAESVGRDQTAADGPAAPATGILSTQRGLAGAILTGLAVGGGSLLAQVLPMMGGLRAVNQSYDNVFHLNAVRHVLRLEDASAWVVGGMTTLPGEETYYPAAWHQAVSLAVQISGQGIPLASNVVMLLLAAVLWPLALMALMRTCTTAGPVGCMTAGVLAGVTGAFPVALMYWGIVLPYFLSMAMMPLVVIEVCHVAGLAPRSAQRLTVLQLVVLLPVVCAAVALAHPRGVSAGMVRGLPCLLWGPVGRATVVTLLGLAPRLGAAVALRDPQGVFAGIGLGLPILLWGTVVRARERFSPARRAGRRLWPLATLTLVALIGSIEVWGRFRPVRGSAVWEPNASLKEAFGQAVSLAPNNTPAFVPLGVVLLGCAAAVLLLSRARWLLAPWAAATAMSVSTRSTPVGDLRYLLTGNWYSDNNRITALVAVAAVPVLALGIESLQRWA